MTTNSNKYREIVINSPSPQTLSFFWVLVILFSPIQAGQLKRLLGEENKLRKFIIIIILISGKAFLYL